MKIKFDFGSKSIPHEIIRLSMSEIINDVYNRHRLQAGKCTVYLNFYDEDGLEQIPCLADGRTVNYLIRAKPYTRIPKDMEYVGKWSVNPEAHLYRKYE